MFLFVDSDIRSAFYYPIIGLINLFIYILQFPNAPSTHSDISLLDVAAGYFGHMDFVTAGELSFPFARDVAALARRAVQKAEMASAAAFSMGALTASTPPMDTGDFAQVSAFSSHPLLSSRRLQDLPYL